MFGNEDPSRTLLIGIVGAAYVLVFGLAQIVGMQIDYASVLRPALWFGGLTIVCSVYFDIRGLNKLKSAVEPVCLGLVILIPNIVATYLAMRVGMPMADEYLAALDASLGFNAPLFIQTIDRIPWLAMSLGLAYQSISIQLLLLPPMLALLGQANRGYKMISAYCLCCFGASMVAIWYPATGTYPYFQISADGLKNIDAHFGYFFLEQFNAVRNLPDFVFSMQDAAGIITFPSVHAAVAVVCAWAAWPLRYLRWPFIGLNVAMCVSALSNGGHYVVDVFAGIALAGICILAVNILTAPAYRHLKDRAPTFNNGEMTTR